MIERIIIPETVKLNSFTNNLTYFSYAENIQEKLFSNGKNKILVEIVLKNNDYFDSLIRNTNYNLKFGDSISLKKDSENNFDTVYCKRLYPFGKLWMQVVENPKKVKVSVNPLYFNIFRFHIENIIPPGIHLRNLTYLALIRSNFLSLHSAAFAINKDCGFLIMAPPNVGKSATVLNAIKDGAYYLSEDITVVDEKSIFSVPYTSTLYHERSKRKYMGLLSYFINAHQPMGVVFKEKLIKKAKLRYICILENSNKNYIKELKKDMKNRVLKTIMLLNQNEFKYMSDEIITSKFYYSKDLAKIKKKEELLFKKILNRSGVFLVRSNNPQNFYKLIKNYIKL